MHTHRDRDGGPVLPFCLPGSWVIGSLPFGGTQSPLTLLLVLSLVQVWCSRYRSLNLLQNQREIEASRNSSMLATEPHLIPPSPTAPWDFTQNINSKVKACRISRPQQQSRKANLSKGPLCDTGSMPRSQSCLEEPH